MDAACVSVKVRVRASVRVACVRVRVRARARASIRVACVRVGVRVRVRVGARLGLALGLPVLRPRYPRAWRARPD